jgi:predicted AAA+ superfamily ATPase
MQTVPRLLGERLRTAAKDFKVLVLTGPRRAGKTTLLKSAFPRASYQLLEDPDVLSRVKADPRGWLDSLRLPAIVDEIQNAPELLPYIRSRVDSTRGRKAQWLLTGSQDFSLMKGASETMAGRAAIFYLLPFSFAEVGSWDLLRGSFPEVVAKPRTRSLWFNSYLQTYIERDIRSLAAVRDLATFRRFLSLLATRTGQLLNKTSLAGPLGISVPTVDHWLSLLETTGVILLVPPYFENLEKRLVKSPKLHWIDSGLVCHLLGLESRDSLETSPFAGAILEGFVATEVVKSQLNAGRSRSIYHFRDQQGLEVDLVIPSPGTGELTFIESKWSKTITSQMARPLQNLRGHALGGSVKEIHCLIVHRQSKGQQDITTVATGVKAIGIETFLKAL